MTLGLPRFHLTTVEYGGAHLFGLVLCRIVSDLGDYMLNNVFIVERFPKKIFKPEKAI